MRDMNYSEELEALRNVQRLEDYWSRPAGPRCFYWYLTFEYALELHSLVRRCHAALSFPYYDLTPLNDLHVTLDRVAFDADITQDQRDAIETAAIGACRRMPPFGLTVGSLEGTHCTVGFNASPLQSILILRDALRAATLSVYPQAPFRCSDLHPHVTIARANSDAPAAEAILAVKKLQATARADVTIKEVVFALLERQRRSYTWRAISRIPLEGSTDAA